MRRFVASLRSPLCNSRVSSPDLGGPRALPWGIGGEALKCSYRGVVPHPMLARAENHLPPSLAKTNSNRSSKGKKMDKSNTKTTHSTPKTFRLLPPILIITLSIFTSACSSQRYKQSRLSNLLNAEETLLHSIEAERSTKTVKQRVEQDQTLFEAEWHLREAIRALFEANQAVRKSL
jgi:hypothetical protein